MTPITINRTSYAGGINAAALPVANLRPDEMPLMVNATVRNGWARTRPPWEWQNLSFVDSTAQAIFEQGKYQGSGFFLSNQGNFHVFALDGHVLLLNAVTKLVTRIILPSGKAPFSKKSPHVWITQRAQWIVAQDGVSAPLRFDGVNAEQTLTVENPITQVVDPSIPVGTIMVEGWGRLFVVDPSRRRIYASDHEMDPNSTPISFTEGTDYYLAARYFEGPPALGRIMGAAFTPYQDSSTGIGPLVVFFEKGTRAYNVAVPRTSWVTQDISQTILPSVGSCSYFAYADKGSEVVFRDQDGRIRTIRNAQQLEMSNANYANDFNIWNLFKDEDSNLRNYSQARTFDRRTLVLTHPERVYLPTNDFCVVHKAVAVMENEHLTDKETVWSFWTGLNICGMSCGPVDGTEVLLALARDPDGVNRVYQMVEEGKFDITPTLDGRGVQKRIQMTLGFPPMDFGDITAPKAFMAGVAKFTGMRGQVDICALWQTDGDQPVKWFNHSENHPNCITFGPDCTLVEWADGAQARLLFPSVPEKKRSFYDARVTLDIIGPATVEECAVAAMPETPPSTTNVSCVTKTMTPPQPYCGVNILCYDAFSASAAPQPVIPPCPPL